VTRRERLGEAAARAGAATMLALPVVSAVVVEGGESADAGRGQAAQGGYASAYGPGLWGNTLACGGRLSPDTVGVAHRWLRCGTRIRVCYRRRCTRARVRDRGPYVGGRELDLTEAVVRRLGVRSATAWGVRFIHYEEVR
jgi:rare lipoprotein A (peptidoglycan hydrolase)